MEDVEGELEYVCPSPRTTITVLLHMCPSTNTCVLVLLHMCPRTTRLHTLVA
jgi:hypothetical protein